MSFGFTLANLQLYSMHTVITILNDIISLEL